MVWPGAGLYNEANMIPVTFPGYQPRLDGTSFLLVNEVKSQARLPLIKKHYLVSINPKKENKNAKKKS